MAKEQARVLIVDDDADVVQSARVVLRQHFTSVQTESNPQQIDYLLAQEHHEVVLLDMNFTTGVTKGSEGLFWLKRIQENHPATSVIMITAYADLKLAVEAMKLGAVDFIVKPWQNEKLIATVTSGLHLSRSRQELSKLKLHRARLSEVYVEAPVIVGKSAPMQRVFEWVSRVAATDASVLILGENGTGKELIAKSIHQQSTRRSGPFVKVDVGAVAESLFESELFGHKKGAFTDAKEDRVGRLELASGGTLFLDEIGNLPMALQVKLLSVLQNRVVVPVGSNNEIPIDVRLVTATNQDLGQAIREGRFREDLFFRLNTVTIDVPPLRERPEDLPDLLLHFVQRYSAKYQKTLRIDDAVIPALSKYRWPGNIRELQHAIERAVILCAGSRIRVSDFLITPGERAVPATGTMDDVERRAIAEAIRKYGGNLSQAAKALGLGRTTLYRKIEKYGLSY